MIARIPDDSIDLDNRYDNGVYVILNFKNEDSTNRK